MSLRSASKVARPLARLAPRISRSAPRRYASTHKQSSDVPWMAGSAVVFGGLAAYISMGGKKADEAAHAVHENITKKASGEHAPIPTSDHNPASEHSDEHENKGTGDNENSIKAIQADPSSKTSSGDKPARKDSQGKEHDDALPAKKNAKMSDNLKDRSSGSAGGYDNKSDKSDDNEDKDGGDEESGTPSKEDIKDSVKQAVKANAPKVAGSDEEKSSEKKN